MIIRLTTRCQFKQQPISRPSDVPPCPSPLPSTEPESLGDDQIESEDSVEEQADDNITRKHAKVEPKRICSALKLGIT